MKAQAITLPSAAAVMLSLSSFILAEPEKPSEAQAAEKTEVEVKVHPEIRNVKLPAKAEGIDKNATMKVELEHVTYNLERTQFVGYYQHGWFEMVSLHDAETKKQIACVYCEGGVPKNFRFSRDGKHLGAEASVGWYVWKIPSFEEVLILGDLDFYKLEKEQKAEAVPK